MVHSGRFLSRLGWPLGLLLLALTGTGCYTVIRHPKLFQKTPPPVQQEIREEPLAVRADADCRSCHFDSHWFSDYRRPYSAFSLYDPIYDRRWQYYYGQPWWWDSWDYPGQPVFVQGQGEDQKPEKKRAFSERRGIDLITGTAQGEKLVEPAKPVPPAAQAGTLAPPPPSAQPGHSPRQNQPPPQLSPGSGRIHKSPPPSIRPAKRPEKRQGKRGVRNE